jgi:hypothetical protein
VQYSTPFAVAALCPQCHDEWDAVWNVMLSVSTEYTSAYYIVTNTECYSSAHGYTFHMFHCTHGTHMKQHNHCKLADSIRVHQGACSCCRYLSAFIENRFVDFAVTTTTSYISFAACSGSPVQRCPRTDCLAHRACQHNAAPVLLGPAGCGCRCTRQMACPHVPAAGIM